MKVFTNDITIGELNKVLSQKENRPRNIRIFIAGMMCSGPKFGLVIDPLAEKDLEYKVEGFSFVVAEDVFEQFGDFEVEFRDDGFVVKSANGAGGCSSCGGSCS